VRGVANPALDYEGPDTPVAAAELQQQTMELEEGSLVENSPRQYSGRC
jgi:hypothetical protein